MCVFLFISPTFLQRCVCTVYINRETLLLMVIINVVLGSHSYQMLSVYKLTYYIDQPNKLGVGLSEKVLPFFVFFRLLQGTLIASLVHVLDPNIVRVFSQCFIQLIDTLHNLKIKVL